MQKKALVLAIGAAFVIQGASAQKKSEPDSVVTLYGKVYPEVIWVSGSGATAADATVATIAATPEGEGTIVRRTEMESNNTRLGVRGHEKLGPNLKAIFQFETAFGVDSAGTAFANRNSFIGLASDSWGIVKLGRMDTPFKSYGDDLSFLGVSSGNFVSTSEILRKTGFGTNSASSFHLRRANAVQYESPTWGGFDFAVQYSTNEAKTATRDPEVLSAAVSYKRGPLYLALAYEEHKDLFGGSRNVRSSQSNFGNQSVSSTDKAVQATISYKLGIHTFAADYIQKKYDENATEVGRFRSYRNNAWLVNWQARWSKNFATQLHYVRAEKGTCSLVGTACFTDGLDGAQLSAGFAYYFSRRTYLFVIGSILRNGTSSRWNSSDLQDVSVGEDIRQIAVGLHTSF